jgi:hypothetical protein
MNLTHEQAREHLRRGFPVLHNGVEIEPTRLANGAYAQNPKNLPDGDQGGAYIATRHQDGHHTRAGLVHVIQSGGGVLHNGSVITDINELPAEATLASGDLARLAAVKQQQDAEAAKIKEAQAATERAIEDARQRAAEARTEAAAGGSQPTQAQQLLAGAPKLGGVPNPEPMPAAGRRKG